jgi:hypothetical protein
MLSRSEDALDDTERDLFAPVIQLHVLRWLQASLGESLDGLTVLQLGLALPLELHHIACGSTRKDAKPNYRVRTCAQCSNGRGRIDLGTYSSLADAVLVSDVWQLLHGDSKRVQLFRPGDERWFGSLRVRKLLRRAERVVDVLQQINSCIKHEGLSMAVEMSVSVEGEETRKRRKEAQARSAMPTCAENVMESPFKVVRYTPLVRPSSILQATCDGDADEALNLLKQLNYLESTVFSVVRKGYAKEEQGINVAGTLLKNIFSKDSLAQEMERINAMEPLLCIQGIYSTMVRPVLNCMSSISNTRASRLMRTLDHAMRIERPPRNATELVQFNSYADDMYRDLLDTWMSENSFRPETLPSSHVDEIIQRTDVFAIRASGRVMR